VSGSLLAAAANPTFARHETFHPRFGWLRKAVSASTADPTVFVDPEAPVILGVGKNMVNAIRYWGLAFKVLERTDNPARPRLPLATPTDLGRQLLGEDGWDPYLEDPASLWLLHWQLLAAPCLAPVWWVAFHDFAARQFTEPQLSAHVGQLAAAAGWRGVLPAAIKKDVDCLLRTYTVRHTGRQGLDDILDCPFRELGLIEAAPGDEDRSWRFVVGEKTNLPDSIVLYAALEFAAQHADGARSISIARLASDPGGPGCAFRLTETAMFEALRRAVRDTAGVEVAEPAGLRQLLFSAPPRVLAELTLRRHYASSTQSSAVSA
jgi:hypothetical protein